ncbi:MAG: hypothetical protein DMH00_06755 [Acidobacteria bacterium]|nr:MAG: hypothetical protein DMH00_06755 [Acidobacteriota bacterium]
MTGARRWWDGGPAILPTGSRDICPARETLADQPGYTYPADYLGRILPSLVTPQQIPLEEVRRFADIDAQDYAAGLQWIAHPPEPPKDKKEKPQVQDPVGMLLKILTAARNYQAVTLDLLGKGPFDLTAVYFEGIDLVGHRFQHCRPPKMGMVSEAEFRKFRRVVSEYYVYQDRLLGELARKAATGTTVLVVSDHGFKTGARRPEGILPYTVDQPVEWHREDGIFILSGRGAAQGRLTKQATLFDITPTVLALLGAPVPADMPGRVLDEALDREFLRHYPPARISTYEGLGAARRTEEEGASDRVSAEMMAQLRALGYVGADSPAPKVSGQGASVEPDATPGQEETTVSYHRNLATYYLSRREYEKAIVELNEANRREKLPKSYAMLAEAYDALGRKREALGVLEAGWKEVPDAMATDSILWCVQLSADLGDPERGKRFLEEHRARLENAPAVRDAAEGVLAETAGKMNEAVRLYQAALAADPTLVAAARPLAALYTREGKLEALRPVLEAGLARSERIDEYHNLLGALDSRAGKKEAALAHFRRAAELNPNDSRFALNVGLTLMDLQSWEEATTVLEKAMAGAPGGDLALALGDARLKLHQPEAALSSFQAAQRLGADPTRADLGMALSYLAMKRRDDALSFLRESLARRPADAALRQLYQDIQAHP